jgi:hypothetical protein
MPSSIKTCLAVAVILFVVLLILWPFLRPIRMPLAIVSFDTNIQVASVVCTFGTNHVYYY